MGNPDRGFADRSDRGKLIFTGPQRAWFLHQIMTQSFEDMVPGEARDTAMITAHGRMVAFMECVMTEDSIRCHFEPELTPTLPDAIHRYVFATQVEVTEATDEFGLVLVLGDDVPSVTVDHVAHPTQALGVPATYLWMAREKVNDAIVELEDLGLAQVSEEELEVIRVSNRVPRWGREMNVKTIPQEVGIETRAVHFDKGCYVGQEAMAKINFRGKVNRRLATLVSGDPLPVGADVVVDGGKAGAVTSAVRLGDEYEALAVVKHTIEPGAEVQIDDVDAKVTA